VTDFDAVVYDLDGTLVRLAVDWPAVRRDLGRVLDEHGLDAAGRDVWGLFDLAVDTGHRDLAEEVIGRHERDGAKWSTRLPLADELPLSVPVGVCSLNCETACRSALQTHGLDDHVDVLPGRDSAARYKPDPAALLAVVEAIGTDPETTLFVGDSDSDRSTAEAAGVHFQWVEERLGDA